MSDNNDMIIDLTCKEDDKNYEEKLTIPPPLQDVIIVDMPIRSTEFVASCENKENVPEGTKTQVKQESRIEGSVRNNLRCLQNAAIQSRLPHDRMVSIEVAYFPDVARKTVRKLKTYLNIRNKILQVWLANPSEELLIEKAMVWLQPRYNTDKILLHRIHKFLEHNGYINFGVFTRLKPISMGTYGKVIVIGAGIAGLAAARQLQHLGFEVMVVEARNRVGGRIVTYRSGNYIADLGAMMITGLGGNPFDTLSKQINIQLYPFSKKCPLYDVNGELVDIARDKMLEKEFNRLLEATSYMSRELNFNYVGNQPVSLGQAFRWAIDLQVKQAKETKIAHYKAILAIQEKWKKHHGRMLEVIEQLNKVSNICDTLKNIPNRDPETDLKYRRQLRVQRNYHTELTLQKDECKKIEEKLAELERTLPSGEYLSEKDLEILEWHVANLEFANATSLDNVSLKHWDQDYKFKCSGNYLTVTNGLSNVTEALSQDLDIKLNAAVQQICYTNNGVSVTVMDPFNPFATNVYQGDVVLCTLPLGVLKQITSEETTTSTYQHNTIKFLPPLPGWKTSVIERLGYGNLNKVVLCFDKVFWDPNINLFGHVNNPSSRGELFLFWNVYEAPVLVAFISGNAANDMEKMSNNVIVDRCLAVLRNIFGECNVPEPKEKVVTRWRTDPWSRGSFSYVALGSSGEDYDIMAAPVCPGGDNNNGQQRPRIFFAGEHTSRTYPATVHGAFLSGLREATCIADQFIGN